MTQPFWEEKDPCITRTLRTQKELRASPYAFEHLAPKRNEETDFWDILVTPFVGTPAKPAGSYYLHKVILASVSPHFDRQIRGATDEPPVGRLTIWWPDERKLELFDRVVDLIYHGTASICRHEEESLAALIRGLDIHLGGDVEELAYGTDFELEVHERTREAKYGRSPNEKLSATRYCKAPRPTGPRFEEERREREYEWTGPPWEADVFKRRGNTRRHRGDKQ